MLSSWCGWCSASSSAFALRAADRADHRSAGAGSADRPRHHLRHRRRHRGATRAASAAATIGLFGFSAVALRLSIDELMAPLILGNAARHSSAGHHLRVPVRAARCSASIGLLLAVPIAASIKIILAIYYAEPVSRSARPERWSAARRSDGRPYHESALSSGTSAFPLAFQFGWPLVSGAYPGS